MTESPNVCPCYCHDPKEREVTGLPEHANCGECCAEMANDEKWCVEEEKRVLVNAGMERRRIRAIVECLLAAPPFGCHVAEGWTAACEEILRRIDE